MSALSDLKPRYDVVVVGGGVHGAAAALEAAQLGCQVLLVEQHDFCSQTSANSLKIIHGGLRYLQTLSLRRSRESAREQSWLKQSAPHLVEPMPCLMGTQRSVVRGRPAMALGLWLYDNVIRFGLPDHPHGRIVSSAEADRLAGRELFGPYTGAALWYDARALDTERLVLTCLKTAERAGARILNYVSATGVSHDGAVSVGLRDVCSKDTTRVAAGVVIDTASLLDRHPHWTRAVNLVLDRRFLDCAVGLRLPDGSAEAGRLFFATPHRDSVIIGTWYFADRQHCAHRLSHAELHHCIADVRALLPGLDLGEKDVTCVHVGRLPVSDGNKPLSLLEKPVIRRVGGDQRVLKVTGVKYTTAGPTARKALRLAGLTARRDAPGPGRWYGAAPSLDTVAEQVRGQIGSRLGGADAGPVIDRLCRQYGAVAVDIAQASAVLPNGLERIPGCDAINAEVQYCIDHEHCRTLSDFMLRRSGIGSLAPPPAGAAEYCARIMARHFDWTEERVGVELDSLSAHYNHVAGES